MPARRPIGRPMVLKAYAECIENALLSERYVYADTSKKVVCNLLYRLRETSMTRPQTARLTAARAGNDASERPNRPNRPYPQPTYRLRGARSRQAPRGRPAPQRRLLAYPGRYQYPMTGPISASAGIGRPEAIDLGRTARNSLIHAVGPIRAAGDEPPGSLVVARGRPASGLERIGAMAPCRRSAVAHAGVQTGHLFALVTCDSQFLVRGLARAVAPGQR